MLNQKQDGFFPWNKVLPPLPQYPYLISGTVAVQSLVPKPGCGSESLGGRYGGKEIHVCFRADSFFCTIETNQHRIVEQLYTPTKIHQKFKKRITCEGLLKYEIPESCPRSVESESPTGVVTEICGIIGDSNSAFWSPGQHVIALHMLFLFLG